MTWRRSFMPRSDPGLVGRSVNVRLGPLSGKSNLRLALRDVDLPYDEEVALALLAHVKQGSRVLSPPGIRALYEAARVALSGLHERAEVDSVAYATAS